MLRTLIATLLISLSTTAMSQTPADFIDASREVLAQQTSLNATTWHLGEEESWSADLDAGVIVFTFANGVTATAPIQVVGTYNKADGTFLWGWDHPSVPAPLRPHAQQAKAWGEQHGVAAFTSRKVECSEDEAWNFAAVTNRLAGTNGVYRGPAGSALVFMTLGQVTLKSANP